MNTITKLFSLFVIGFIASACALDNDTPTPTPMPTKEIFAVAPPAGTIVAPEPSPPSLPVKTLKIGNYDPEGHVSRIVVAGTDKWERFAAYTLCADPTEDLLVSRVIIESGTRSDLLMDNADFTAVGVRFYLAVVGVGIFPSGPTGKVSIEIKPAIRIKGCMPIQLVAMVAPISASSTVGGTWTGVCRSGHAPALGLAKKASDPTMLDVDIVGEKTGTKYVARAHDTMRHGNPMVIRKSKPNIRILPLSATKLVEGLDQDLLKIEICPDHAGPIALKNLGFRVKKPFDVKLSNDRDRNWRLRKGTVDFDSKTVRPFVPWDSTEQIFIFKFLGSYEEILWGCTIYTFHSPVTGLTPGATVNTIVDIDHYYGKVVTGTISEETDIAPWYVKGGPILVDSFVWSDMSEVPHFGIAESAGGSADWSTSDFVEYVGFQTLY